MTGWLFMLGGLSLAAVPFLLHWRNPAASIAEWFPFVCLICLGVGVVSAIFGLGCIVSGPPWA